MSVRDVTALSILLFLAACGAPASADVAIHVDKGTQTMDVSVDGVATYSWPVSTGMAGRDTPSVSARPQRMEAEHFSKEWDDAPMPYSIFFTNAGHAIHGSNQIRHLGHAASHGCVRLSVAHARTLFDLVKAEGTARTRIVVDGELPRIVEPRVARSVERPRYGRAYDEDGYPVRAPAYPNTMQGYYEPYPARTAYAPYGYRRGAYEDDGY